MSLNTRRRLLPWLFIGPGLLWLLIFFLYPLLNQASVSLMSGNPEEGYTLTWAFDTYWNAISDYKEQFGRSILYAGIATILCLIIALPARVLHRLQGGALEGLHPAADHPAVLHVLRAAHGGMAVDPLRRRHGRECVANPRPAQR